MAFEEWTSFVISLAGAEKRREDCKRLFEQLGFAPVFVEAIDGAALDDADLAGYYDATKNHLVFKRPLSRPEIGCYLSHYALWMEISRRPEPGAFIFEDDVAPLDPEIFISALSRITELRLGADIIKLHQTKPLRGRSIAPISDDHEIINCRVAPPFTTGYAITRSAAATLAQSVLPFARPVDMDLKHWWEFGIRTLAVRPGLVVSSGAYDSRIDAGRHGAEIARHAYLRRFFRNLQYQAQFHSGLAKAHYRSRQSARQGFQAARNQIARPARDLARWD